jgi:hypothetical protein
VLPRLTVRIVLRVQTLFVDKLPEPLKHIPVGGISGSVEHLNPHGLRDALHQRAPLIARVGQDDRHRDVWVGGRSPAPSLTPRRGGTLGQLLDRQHLVCARLQGRSYLHPLAPRGGFDKEPLATPDEASKGGAHTGGRIHEQPGALASASCLYPGLPAFF